MDTSPTICVIGAGACGLAVAKNLLQEGITSFIVFEKNAELGGNWLYSEEKGHSSVYETTHIISSKRLSQYEDFPMPEGYPDYPSHRQVLKYFQEYAKHFHLLKYIHFNTLVQSVERMASGQWRVLYKDQHTQQEKLFDVLVVANGHHWNPVLPDYQGQFTGQILHAHQYKKASVFKNHRVLVVGGGNSACDISVEISRVAQKTYLSMRSPQHIFPKFIFGKPTDVAFKHISWMPLWLKEPFVRAVIRLIQGRYAKYALQTPSKKPLEVHPTINSELLYYARHGKIIPHVGIKYIKGDTVYFMDGKKESIDTIIFATGYQISFPFFDKQFIDYSKEGEIPLYRKMIHKEFDNLFFIGLFQPQGCIWPLADLQAKLMTKMIKGEIKRPKHLSKKIQRELKNTRTHYKKSSRHAIEVDYHQFRKQLLKHLASLSL